MRVRAGGLDAGVGGRGSVGGGCGGRERLVVGDMGESADSSERRAAPGRGQSSGVSGYSIGLSAIPSIIGRLRKALGRTTSWSEPVSSGSDSLYHIVP